MWAKTSAAIIGGCLVSISIMLNLNFLLPLAVDSRLLIGLLAAFPLWVATMVLSYASRSGWHAWQRCGGILLLSVGVNVFFVLG